MTDTNHLTQASKLFDQYTTRVFSRSSEEIRPLSEWLTEDLVRLYHLIDVELQERAFNAEFPAVTDNIRDDFGPAED